MVRPSTNVRPHSERFPARPRQNIEDEERFHSARLGRDGTEGPTWMALHPHSKEMNIKLAPASAHGCLTGSSKRASASYFDKDTSAGAEARVFFWLLRPGPPRRVVPFYKARTSVPVPEQD